MYSDFDDISNYEIFFEEKGGFHDAEVREIKIDFTRREINLFLSDPLINFAGTADYRAIELLQINISFDDSLDIEIDFKTKDTNLTIYDITASNNFIYIQLSPSGFIKAFINKLEMKIYGDS